MDCDLFIPLRLFNTRSTNIPCLLPNRQMPMNLIRKRSRNSSSLLFPYFAVKVSTFAAVELNPTTTNLHETSKSIPRRVLAPYKHNSLAKSEAIVGSDVKERLKNYSGLLRECASRGSLNEGRAIHGSLIRSGLEPDSHLWVSLINFYTKCGSGRNASKVFDEMPERDAVSWTALISGFVNEGRGSEGVGLYWEMRKSDVKPNEFALATVLKACSLCLDVEFGKQVHAEAIKSGLLADLFVGSALVDLYAKCGEMGFADRVFFEMPEKNAVSWNALLNGYARKGDGNEVLKFFLRMTECGMDFDKFSLSTVLKGCTNTGNLKAGRVLHSLALRSGFEIDEFLGCSLLDMYSKCGAPFDAVKVFRLIKDPDVVTWSALIAGLDQQGHYQEAIEIFHEMRQKGIKPNQYTLASVVSAYTALNDLRVDKAIHACICKSGFGSDNTVNNALIMMYMRSGCLEEGMKLFEEMPNPDLVSWNALLSGFHELEFCDHGPKFFNQMLVEGFKPNIYSYISMLRSCSSRLDVGLGKQVHAHILKNNIQHNDFVGTALLDMYAKNRYLKDAETVFYRLINRDIFSWTVIISGLLQTDQAEKGFRYFARMRREGVKPNEYTLASCLSGCSCMAMLDNGRQIHSLAVKAGCFGDVFVASALVDMYGKCGCVEDAEAIFESLVSRDTVTWTTIICGYSQNGQGEKALQAFKMMLDEDIKPDEVTFIGVLSACSYMGLVDEGKKLFDSMNKVYEITPMIEHYVCMVDILGRAGKFDEAEIFIEKMKLMPYPLIWETVLGACKLHGNVDLGERAAKKLIELQPKIDSSYILLSNIFAAKGMWDDVRKVRELMSTQGVKKEPGCSWVEIDGQVHVFTSQDASHPEMSRIYEKLNELADKLVSVGYTPRTEDVLHDMSDREKMQHLYLHSERLALAFALIRTNPPKTIRIFKNLRICKDCHDVMKMISSIESRKIVVRDIKRFHHFERGTCSCQNCW